LFIMHHSTTRSVQPNAYGNFVTGVAGHFDGRVTARCLGMFALLAALISTASSASAATPETVRPLAAGPVFAGDGGLAWATYDRDLVQTGGVFGFVVRRRAPEGTLRVIGTSRPAANSDEERTPYLLSTPKVIVAGSITRTTGSGAFPPGGAPADVLSWGADGTPGARFGACASAVGAPTLRPGVVDLDANTVVDCDADGEHLDVFDAPTGALSDQIPAAHPVSARIAGPYVAWLEPAASADVVGRYTLVVFDRRSRTESLRTTTTTLGDGLFTAWDLGSDGTVAYAIGSTRTTNFAAPGRLGWTSVVAPTPHSITVPTVRFPVLRLEGQTVTYTSLLGTSFDLRTVRLDGTAYRAIAHRATRDFDLRGSRIAFGIAGCAQDRIRVQAVTARTYDPSRRDCQLPVPRTLRAHGARVVVKLDCRSLPFSCDGTMTLRGRSSSASLLGRGEITSGAATIRLTTTARRALAHSGTLGARLSATMPSIYDENTSLVRARNVSLTTLDRR
jgi:hypothetical protein